jgi:hypothetical protein
MTYLFKQLFRGHAREAWSHSNLEPVETVFRVNWELYAKVMQARARLTASKMLEMRTNQMFNHNAKTTPVWGM